MGKQAEDTNFGIFHDKFELKADQNYMYRGYLVYIVLQTSMRLC